MGVLALPVVQSREAQRRIRGRLGEGRALEALRPGGIEGRHASMGDEGQSRPA